MKIGKVAKSLGVSVETVRYYERSGLIEQPEKPAGGYRQYSSETIKRISFIKKAQELGFSLNDIKELLSLKIDENCKCGQVKTKTLSKLNEIENKINDLKRMKNVLSDLADACDEGKPIGDCPILDAIEHKRF